MISCWYWLVLNALLDHTQPTDQSLLISVYRWFLGEHRDWRVEWTVVARQPRGFSSECQAFVTFMWVLIPVLSTLHKDPQPLCIPCHSPFSIEHILTECIDFQPIRVNYYSNSDISQLFHKMHPSSTLQYMKDIRLYKNLSLSLALNSLFVLKNENENVLLISFYFLFFFIVKCSCSPSDFMTL